MKSWYKICFIAVLAASVMGCNTMRGVGKDVQSAGQGIQKTVDHND